MPTIPFIRPDGTPTLVDQAHSQDAVNSGYKPAMRLARPDGSQTTVAFDDLHHALAAGYKQTGDTGDSSAPQQQSGIVPSIGRFLGGAGEMAAGIGKSIYHAATDQASSNPLANALAMGSGAVAKRLLIDPQIQQGQQAVQSYKAGDTSSAIGHGLAAITPVVGPFAASATEAIAPDVASGNYAGASGKAATLALLGELSRRGINGITPEPTNLTPQQIAARGVAKAVLPKEGDFNSLTDVLQREKGNVDQFAADKGLTTNTPLNTGVAARQSANDLSSFYKDQLLAPKAGERVNIPTRIDSIGNVGTSIKSGAPYGAIQRSASLGEIDARIGQLNDLLRGGQNNATMGQTMTDLAKMADLQAEKTALTGILHDSLGSLHGIPPEAVAGIRQSIGARYELADQLQSAANRTTLKAGTADRTGSTISKPTVASTILDTANRVFRGGPENIANRAFQKTYPKLNVPAGVGNPVSLEELKSSGLAQYLK